MNVIEWTEAMKRGIAFQDADHKQQVALMNAMQTCSDDEMPAAFAKHFAHIREHLGRENDLMERTDFYAKDVHMGVHESVLAELDAMQAKLDAGDIAAVRVYVCEDLPLWFLSHLETMDTMTAEFALQQGES